MMKRTLESLGCIWVLVLLAGCGAAEETDSSAEGASALSAVTCQQACTSDYRECTRTCWGQGCQQCPRLRTECLAACTTDTDGDGLLDTADNCPTTPNPSQANCDGDTRGDACDIVNGTYVRDPQVFTCKIDRDEHVGYDTLEHHVETRDYDTSACHGPDIWNQSIRTEMSCYDFNGNGDNSLYGCCVDRLSNSLTAVGGPYSVEEWCTAPRFDRDYCHR